MEPKMFVAVIVAANLAFSPAFGAIASAGVTINSDNPDSSPTPSAAANSIAPPTPSPTQTPVVQPSLAPSPAPSPAPHHNHSLMNIVIGVAVLFAIFQSIRPKPHIIPVTRSFRTFGLESKPQFGFSIHF